MTATRIYAPAVYTPGATLDLPDPAREHLRARRLRPGHGLTLFDGSGHSAGARLERLDKRGAQAAIEYVAEGGPEAALPIRLLQGMSKGDAMDTVVQKATELGVASILPVYTDHAVVRLKGERAARKHEHWQRVAISACEQCGRNTLPSIAPPQGLDEATAGLDAVQGVVISAAATQGMGSLTWSSGPIALAVGPEGGFSDTELERLTGAGWQACRLGPRILRTETAAIAGLTAIGLLGGDLG
jgi:16S rRNA (uracil1498-N3)-methyltransferase